MSGLHACCMYACAYAGMTYVFSLSWGICKTETGVQTCVEAFLCGEAVVLSTRLPHGAGSAGQKLHRRKERGKGRGKAGEGGAEEGGKGGMASGRGRVGVRWVFVELGGREPPDGERRASLSGPSELRNSARPGEVSIRSLGPVSMPDPRGPDLSVCRLTRLEHLYTRAHAPQPRTLGHSDTASHVSLERQAVPLPPRTAPCDPADRRPASRR